MPIDEDNDMSVLAYNQYLEDHTERDRNKVASEFEELGEQFVKQIDKKKKRQKVVQVKLIPYILKHAGDLYDREELEAYHLEDVQKIYDDLKKEKKPWITKFFNFLFNIE